MASAHRPTKPRRCAPKAAKPRPAPARPSTSKPRAQGKPGPILNEPFTPGPSLRVAKAAWAEITKLRKQRKALQQRLQATQDDRAVAEANCVRYAEENERLNEKFTARALAADQITQLACKRLRSALGPLGQGSTTGHMLAMIEQLIEDRNFAGHYEQAAREAIKRMRTALGETSSQPDQTTPGDLTTITDRLIEALNDRAGTFANAFALAPEKISRAVAAMIAVGCDDGPRCEQKGQCEDLDGSACYGCGRWLGDEPNEKPPSEIAAVNNEDSAKRIVLVAHSAIPSAPYGKGPTHLGELAGLRGELETLLNELAREQPAVAFVVCKELGRCWHRDPTDSSRFSERPSKEAP